MSRKNVLFVSGEVAPYVRLTEVAGLAQTLPAQLYEAGVVEPRIMMPRYGKVSERKNRLHEVIRLSGTEIPMGKEVQVLKVKVSSIPGLRLQVYFMDNVRYFKKKAIYTDASGQPLADNPERALFFGRAVLETLRKLGWAPDIVHAFSWITGFIPYLLRTEYAEDPLFARTRVVYTPDTTGLDATPDLRQVRRLGLPEALADTSLDALARQYADIHLEPTAEALQQEGEGLTAFMQQFYEDLMEAKPRMVA